MNAKLEKISNFVKANKFSLALLSMMMFALFFTRANAGSQGQEFSQVYDMITGWAQGTLGRIICIAIVLVGISTAVKNGTLMPVVVAIGAAIVLYNAPSIVEGILSATVDANVATESLQNVSNGLLK
ncbi:TraA family conjugative transfer protein [Succinivibrio dextrinosolvens]|uniref:TraA family conjugative transfer protein n=1 Tax=Succinivibrio dextrinosolvens TaxID=83771 RepID=UPI00241E5D99|nr:TraA family conjugative transfer protein [Succinivibrio dextrinosolvens]MBE6423090.1 hypothetical protein [Succinivibrio dextrinosolvens]